MMQPRIKTTHFFGTLFATLLIIMTACSSTYQTRTIDDDDVYYSQVDQGTELDKEAEQLTEESEYKGYKPTKEEQNKDEERKEVNRTILRTAGYIMLEGLYLFLIFN